MLIIAKPKEEHLKDWKLKMVNDAGTTEYTITIKGGKGKFVIYFFFIDVVIMIFIKMVRLFSSSVIGWCVSPVISGKYSDMRPK